MVMGEVVVSVDWWFPYGWPFTFGCFVMIGGSLKQVVYSCLIELTFGIGMGSVIKMLLVLTFIRSMFLVLIA